MINNLLTQLNKVKQTGNNRWIACCPSHQDKSPSLAIRETDGTILLKCFVGCSAHEIVSAVGMDLSDLFPESDEFKRSIKNPFPATDILRCIQTEALIVAVAACNIAQNMHLTEMDRERLLVAAGRIQGAYHG